LSNIDPSGLDCLEVDEGGYSLYCSYDGGGGGGGGWGDGGGSGYGGGDGYGDGYGGGYYGDGGTGNGNSDCSSGATFCAVSWYCSSCAGTQFIFEQESLLFNDQAQLAMNPPKGPNLPNSGGGGPSTGASFWQDWVHELKTCVLDIGLSTAANDMNPFSPGIGTAADVTSQMSQASLGAAAAWSVQQGLTVPLRSSIVRAGATSAETLGKASGLLTMGSVVYALGDGVVAEYNGCL